MFYSDRPINSNAEDKLNRKGFAKILAQTLANLDSKDTFTIGLFGKWGCGKTSLVNMTLEELENIQSHNSPEKQVIVIHFEPWNFTDTNQLLTQFFVRLANEFQKKGDQNLTKIGKALESYSDAFSLFELIPGVGAPIASVGKWGVSHLGQKIQKGLDERDVLNQKNQVIQLLKAQANRILIILDDIDRLSNEQIRYVFQLITSVARFPNTTYLLVFDKEIVVEALKGVQSGNGQDYLEKIIQMPIQIPEIQHSALRNVLFEQLDRIIVDFKELRYSQKRWQRLFESCVDPFITHLRDINRLCNVLRFKLTGISSEIDFTDMLAISILEIHHPLVYDWVKNNKSVLTGENDYSPLGVDKTPKAWLAHYSEMLGELVSLEHPEASVECETELVINLLVDLFPHFGQRVGKTYEVYDKNQLNRNNQIAHPDKFDRYFQLDINSIAYRTVDVLNVIYRWDENDIIAFLLEQEEKDTSYELLEDIRARITELSGKRAKVLIRALFRAMKNLNGTVRRSWFSVSTGAYAEHIMLDLMEQIPVEERVPFISDLISESKMDALPSIATVINMLELGYGRLAAEGQEKNYKKVITLNELVIVEAIFTKRIKEILKTRSLFDFSKWNIIYYLLNSFDPEYTKHYLDSVLTQDENILWFLGYFVTVWIGSGKEYEIQEGYADFFSTERVFRAIEVCRKNGVFFKFPEELQHKCAAFFLCNSESLEHGTRAYEHDTEKIIASWKS
ncbi:MAG: KAP family P-loop NTPase fold protein [Candidatus Pararuminococcus gallinarum]